MNYVNTYYFSYNNYISTKYNNYYNNFYKYYKLKQIKNHRQQLKQIKNINDCIKFLKSFCKNNSCADNILNKIYILYLYEQPTDTEIQQLSILQQQYQDTYNIEEYTITTLWCCIIYYIDNLPKIKRQHSW